MLPRRRWTRKVPLSLKDPNHCTLVFNEELHETIGSDRVVKVFNHFSSSIKRNGVSLSTICSKFFKDDGLHPNKTGSKLLGALLSKCLCKALKSGKFDSQKVLPTEVVLERSDGAIYSKKQAVSDIHQPKGAHPRMVIRGTYTPPPQMDDLNHFPCLPKKTQPHEAGGKIERGVSGTGAVLLGYDEAVKKVVTKKTTPPPKVREKRTCKCMLYFTSSMFDQV